MLAIENYYIQQRNNCNFRANHPTKLLGSKMQFLVLMPQLFQNLYSTVFSLQTCNCVNSLLWPLRRADPSTTLERELLTVPGSVSHWCLSYNEFWKNLYQKNKTKSGLWLVIKSLSRLRTKLSHTDQSRRREGYSLSKHRMISYSEMDTTFLLFVLSDWAR